MDQEARLMESGTAPESAEMRSWGSLMLEEENTEAGTLSLLRLMKNLMKMMKVRRGVHLTNLESLLINTLLLAPLTSSSSDQQPITGQHSLPVGN